MEEEENTNPLMLEGDSDSLFLHHYPRGWKAWVKKHSGLTYLLGFISFLMMGVVITALAVSFHNRWITSTRTTTYQVDYFTDNYGDDVRHDQIPVEETKPMDRLTGRITIEDDGTTSWVLNLKGPNHWIGTYPTAYLWLQDYNETSGYVDHINGSPCVLDPFAGGSTTCPPPGDSTLRSIIIESASAPFKWVIPLL